MKVVTNLAGKECEVESKRTTGRVSPKRNENCEELENEQYFAHIVNFVLNEDKFRGKLLKLAWNRNAMEGEKAFPKQSATDRFDYVGSGSYAVVYRHETMAKAHRNKLLPGSTAFHLKGTSRAEGVRTSIIKLIDVFSESLLKNLIGLCSRSSVTTYRDAYNEFKISLTLSYLNDGISFDEGKKMYSCSIFPEVYACHIVKDNMPSYFKNSSETKRLDYERLKNLENVPTGDNNEADEKEQARVRSKPSLKEIVFIKAEIAALKMEDCGQPIYEMMKTFKPFEILSLAKQTLLGFMVAESAFEFEHRDLHMGNILVKRVPNQYISFMYLNQVFTVPSYFLQLKIIDTTFSRLKLKNRVFYRDLCHLFEEKQPTRQSCERNRLSHQEETYQAMAKEIHADWVGHHPRTNIYWLIYTIKKFLRFRTLRKNVSREAQQVKNVLGTYIRILFHSKNMHHFFLQIHKRPELNCHVPITVGLISDNKSALK